MPTAAATSIPPGTMAAILRRMLPIGVYWPLLVRQEPPAERAALARRARRVQPERRARRVRKVRKAIREFRAIRVSREIRVLLVQRAEPAQLVRPGPRV